MARLTAPDAAGDLLGVKVPHWEAHVLDPNLLAALLYGGNVNVEVLHVTVLLKYTSTHRSPGDSLCTIAYPHSL